MEQKYCPSCGQDVPLETSLEAHYLLTSCAICGLGLGVKLASTEHVRRFRMGDSTEPDPTDPALARVGVVKREVAVSAAVERPTPPDSRSASPSPAPPPGPQHPVFASVEQPAIRPDQSSDRLSLAAASIHTSGEWAPGLSSETTGERVAREAIASGTGARNMRRVVIVEDSELLRQITRDLLVERELANEVIDCDDGMAFIESFTRAVIAGEKPDLIVLDVKMPGIDGRETAYAIRAIETGLGVDKRTPILFFSAMLCDADFKSALRDIGNARYIRKGDGSEPAELGARIASVLERLLGASKK